MEVTLNTIRAFKLMEHLEYKYPPFGIAWIAYDVVRNGKKYVYNRLTDEQRIFIKHTINNHKAKRKRCNQYLKAMSEKGQLTWCTFTFTDVVLEYHSAESRERYVKDFLNKYCFDWYANLDFGDQTHREHYHAVVIFQNKSPPVWPYGFYKYKDVKQKSLYGLTGYITKLVNHANKISSKRCFHKRKPKEKSF